MFLSHVFPVCQYHDRLGKNVGLYVFNGVLEESYFQGNNEACCPNMVVEGGTDFDSARCT